MVAGSNEQKPTSRIRKGELTRRCSYAPVPAPLFVSEGIYFFFRTHPLEVRWSWNCGAAAYRWSSAVRGHRHFAFPRHLGRQHPSFPEIDQRGEHGGQRDWSRPTIDYSKPVFHSSRITSTRTQCRSWRLTSASNLPRGRRKDSEARTPHRWPRKSSTTEPYPEGSQFADNVNSHPVSLSHGDSHQDPDRPRGEGKIPGPQRLASQVMNHRTISRRLPVVKNSTVSDDFPVMREVEKEESLSSG